MTEAKKIKLLGEQLQQDPTTHSNNVAALLRCLDTSYTEGAVKAAVQALKLFFVDMSETHDLKAKRRKVELEAGTQAAPEDVYREWLQRQYSGYVQRLLALLQAKTAAGVQVAVISALMEAVRGEEVGVFASQLYRQVMAAVLTSPHTRPEVFAVLASKYVQYADVRYHTLRAVAVLAADHLRQQQQQQQQRGGSANGVVNGHSAQPGGKEGRRPGEGDGPASNSGTSGGRGGDAKPEAVARSLYDTLSLVEGAFEEEGVSSWCGAAEVGAVAVMEHKVRKRKRPTAGGAGQGGGEAGTVAWATARQQRKAFGDAWLEFLKVPLPDDVLRKVLLRLPTAVIPYMPNPQLLSDFLTHALDKGGMTGMLALNGIFLLVTRHGLEYPAFYRRLYNLLTPDAFAAKHRATFFQLADVFLASSLVPAYTVAAFAKRLARLALTAPTAGALLCIAFLHNLLRRHPSCTVLLHRPPARPAGPLATSDAEGTEGRDEGLGRDPYDPSAEDPAESRAVESSLWEVAALRRHHCPQVSAFVTILDKDLGDRTKTAEVDLEPLLPNSFSSLFAAEATRRLKSAPVAFYPKPPPRLFDTDCAEDFGGWALGLPEAAAAEAAGS